MKKKTIAVILILVTLISIISNVSLATGVQTNQVANTTSANIQANATNMNAVNNEVQNSTTNNTNDVNNLNQVADNVLGEPDVPPQEDGVMPISDSIEINDETEFANWVESDVYLFDEKIVYNESVNGNVYAMGKNVEVNSSIISGNLFVCGDNVIINADISGSLFICANKVTIKSGANDAYIAADTVRFEDNSYIYRDVRVAASDVEVKGYIYRNLYSGADNISIASNGVAGVAGTIYYDGNLNVSDKSKIGNIVKIETPIKEKETSVFDESIIDILSKVVSALVIIGILTLITRNKEVVKKNENYVIDALVGLALMFLVPVIAIACMITIIGIPVGLLLIMVYIMLLFVSIYVAALKIAKVIMRGNSNVIKYIVAIIIYVTFECIGMIPVAGGILKLIIIAYGFKTIMSLAFQKTATKEDKEKKEDNEIKEEPKDISE